MSGKKRILLGEDDLPVLKVTRARLQTAGYEVVTAADGEEVLRQASSGGAVDLILLDIKMPKLDGFQVCKRLKDQPETGAIPIIIFSGSESHWNMLSDKCAELGIQDWLQKPFETHVLLDKVRRALCHSRMPLRQRTHPSFGGNRESRIVDSR